MLSGLPFCLFYSLIVFLQCWGSSPSAPPPSSSLLQPHVLSTQSSPHSLAFFCVWCPTDSISASSPVSAGPLPWWEFEEVMRTFGSWNGGTVFLHVDLKPVLQYLPKSQHLQSTVLWVLKFFYPPLQPQALSPNWLFMLQNYVKGFVLSYRLDSVPLNASLKVS